MAHGRHPESGRTRLALAWPPPSTSTDVGVNPSRVRGWQVHDDPNPTHEHCTHCSALQSCSCQKGGRMSSWACWRAEDGAAHTHRLLTLRGHGQGKLETCSKTNRGAGLGLSQMILPLDLGKILHLSVANFLLRFLSPLKIDTALEEEACCAPYQCPTWSLLGQLVFQPPTKWLNSPAKTKTYLYSSLLKYIYFSPGGFTGNKVFFWDS